MADPKAARRSALCGMGQKDLALRATPLRLGWGKVLADIALGQRTIDRIGQRVHADIGVGVSQKPALMRDLDATQPQMISGAKRMHVKAVAASDVHLLPFQDRLGAGKIAGIGQFQIVLVTRHNRHVHPRRARHLDIIGGPGRVIEGLPRELGFEYFCKSETLRRLRPKQPVARMRAGDLIRRAVPQRIGDGKRRCGGIVALQRVQHAGDDGGRDQRARGVMDQHAGDARPLQRQQSRADRGIPGGAARHDHRLICIRRRACVIVGMDHQHATVQTGKRGQSMRHHRTTGQHLPLLWRSAARAQAASGGDNDGGCGHRVLLVLPS